jgi:hypothetical protein
MSSSDNDGPNHYGAETSGIPADGAITSSNSDVELSKAEKQAAKLARKAERAELRRKKEERRLSRLSVVNAEMEVDQLEDDKQDEKEEGSNEVYENEKENGLLVPETQPTDAQPSTPSSTPTVQISKSTTIPSSSKLSTERQPLSSYTPPPKTPKPKNGKIGVIALSPPPASSEPLLETKKRKTAAESSEVGANAYPAKKLKQVKAPGVLVEETQPQQPLIRKKKKKVQEKAREVDSDSEDEQGHDNFEPTRRAQGKSIHETITSQTPSKPSSSLSTTKPKSKPIPRTKAPQPNAKAGPSTPSRTPRSSTKKPTNTPPQRTQAETDESLRRTFRFPGSMEAYLSSGWIAIAELKRLEEAGGALSHPFPFHLEIAS